MDDFGIQYVGIFNKGGYSISGGNTVVRCALGEAAYGIVKMKDV